MRQRVGPLPVCGLMICGVILLAIFSVADGITQSSIVHAQGPTVTPLPNPTTNAPTVSSADAVLAEARRIDADAAQSVTTVNTMLSFIQVLGLLVTAGAVPLIVAALAIGARTINQYRHELARVNKESTLLGDQLKQARDELQVAQSELADMRSQIIREVTERIENLSQVETHMNETTQAMLHQGETAILALALLQLGRQQVSSGNLDTALQLLTEAHELDPNSPATNYFLGDVYIRLGEADKGIEYLGHAMRDKEYMPMEAALAYALRMKGDQETDPNKRNRYYAQAEERFLKILEKSPHLLDINGEALAGSLGGLYRRENRLADAIRSYEQASAVTPDSSYPVSKLAILYALQGNQVRATAYFQRTILLASRELDGDPFDTWARFDMITAQVALGKVDEALKTLDPA